MEIEDIKLISILNLKLIEKSFNRDYKALLSFFFWIVSSIVKVLNTNPFDRSFQLMHSSILI